MMTAASHRRLATVAAVLWMAVIFLLSSQSTLPKTGGLPVDVAAIAGHLLAYAVLATLIRLAIGGIASDWRADLVAIALATIYGVTDEFHQSFVPGRDASPIDLGVDLVGSILGVTLLGLVRSVRGAASGER